MNRREFIRQSVATVPVAAIASPFRADARQPGDVRPAERYTGLVRPHKLDLNGDWHFREDPKGTGEPEGWFRPGRVRGRTSRVPVPWQLAFDDMKGYSGTAWYERSFTAPKGWAPKRVAVVFEAVDHAASVWINGKPAGGHEGGQTPFLLDITDLVRHGAENVITVKVTDPSEGLSYFMDTHSLINVSGIWRNVWLETSGKMHVGDIFAIPDIARPGADVRIRVAGPPQSKEPGAKLRIRLTAPDGQLIEREEQLRLQRTAAGVEQELTVPIDISNPILWELDAPQLYSAEVSVESGGVVVDSASTEFGMRRIEARGDRVYLNNRPLYLVGGGLDPGPYGGAVDINWHLPPPYALPSDETIQRDIRTTKSLGVNFVRVPLRSADPRFLYWADRMGLLVMQGGPWTPTEGIVGKEGFDRYKEWWTEAILRDRNHPSLVLWELFNESFGISWEQFKAISAALFEHVKALDPTRFVLDNAGGRYLNEINYIGNHGKTDLHDVHSYPSFAVGVEGANFEQRYPKNTRDLWLGLRSSGKPVLITEFAPAPYVYNVDKIKQKWAGKEPWWFQSRPKRTAMPAQWDHVGFEERFQRWRFDELYGDFTGFTDASDWYYFEGLKFQTELMRMNPETAGFVSWLFDSAPHPVGSIDFYKDKKVYCEELAKVWTQDLVILDNLRHNTWAGETIRADVHVSHFSHAKLKDGRIQWWLEGSELRGEIGGISLQPGEVKRVGEIVFRAPQVPAGKAMRLLARLLLGSETLSENGISVRVFPIEDRRPSVQRVNFVGMDHSRFQVLGYDVAAPGQKPSHPGMNFDPSVPVAVTLSLDNPALRQYLKEGGSVILMVCSEANYWERRPVARMPAVERFLEPNGLALGGRFQGGHSDSFFVRRNVANLFKRIPFRNPITWPFYRVWPNNTLLGMKAEEQSDVIAGAYGNLIRSIPMDTVGKQRWSEVNATVAQFRCGKGRLIVSTFELASPCLDDPIAAIMLNDLIQYAASDFAPKREFLLS